MIDSDLSRLRDPWVLEEIQELMESVDRGRLLRRFGPDECDADMSYQLDPWKELIAATESGVS